MQPSPVHPPPHTHTFHTYISCRKWLCKICQCLLFSLGSSWSLQHVKGYRFVGLRALWSLRVRGYCNARPGTQALTNQQVTYLAASGKKLPPPLPSHMGPRVRQPALLWLNQQSSPWSVKPTDFMACRRFSSE